MPRPDRSPPPTALSQLAAAFRAMRKRKALTQAGLAERTGGVQGHISAIERGTHDPRASTLLAMAAALGCELILVPRETVSETRRASGLTGRAAAGSVLDEVFVPEPEADHAD
jgi:HTH-type transcriptional regulator/antitoxin HipB